MGNEDYDPKPHLERFGYLWYARGKVEAGASVDEILKLAIRTYQERGRLEVTGEIDDETIELMEAPRCGNLDFYEGRNCISLYPCMQEDFDPKKFLEAYRFMGLSRAHLAKDRMDASEEEVLELAVKKFQETYGIPVTGKLEGETVERMKGH